jgi:hypothetical protein
VSRQIGHYADAIRVPAGYEQTITTGRPRLTAKHEPPGNVTEQAREPWQKVAAPSTTGQDPGRLRGPKAASGTLRAAGVFG